MTTAATISAQLILDSSKFMAGIKQAERATKSFQNNVASKITNFGTGINSAISGLSSGLQQAGSTITRNITLPLVGAGAGLLALGANALQAGSTFDTQMKNIQSISMQTDAEIKMLGHEFLKMSEDLSVTTDSAAKLAEGFYFIQSSGFAGADGMEVLRVSTKAATAGLSDTETASHAILATLNAYGLEARDAAHVSDVLFKTVDLGVLTFNDLASQLGDVVNTAATVGVSIETVGAAISQMTRKGVSAPEAVTALNQLLLQFISPSEKMKKSLEAIGLPKDFLSMETLRVRGLQGALEDLTDADPDALLKVFGDNVRALKGALTLGGENMPDFIEMLDQMGNVAGRTDEAFATQTQSMEAYGKNIKNVVENIKIRFTEAFGPTVTKLVGKFSGFLTDNTGYIGGLFEKLGGMFAKFGDKLGKVFTPENGRKFFMFINSIIDGLPEVYGHVEDFVKSVIEIFRLLETGDFRGGIFGLSEDSPLIDALFKIREFFMKSDFSSGDIMTFILGLATLGPVLTTIGAALPTIVPMLLAIASGIEVNGPAIMAFFMGLIENVPTFLANLQAMGEVLGPILQKVVDFFVNMTPEQLNLLLMGLGILALMGPPLMILGQILTGVASAWTLIQTVLVPLITFITATAIPAVIAFVVANAAWIVPLIIIIALIGLLYIAFQKNFLGIRDIAVSVSEKIVGAVDALIVKIQSFLANLQALSGWSPPPGLMQFAAMMIGGATGGAAWVTAAGSTLRNTRNRDGGPSIGFAGQPYMIGKGAQPEMFVPSTNGSFYPNADEMGGGGDTFNIEINNPRGEPAENDIRRALKLANATRRFS